MRIIDPHHHLWDLDKLRYPWLTEGAQMSLFGSHAELARNYLLADFLSDTGNQTLVKSVHLQAECAPEQAVRETEWLAAIPGEVPAGIVAFADLSSSDAQAVLEAHCAHEKVRGIRQILNYHEDPRLSATPRNLLEEPLWQRNFGLLEQFGLSFDLQLFWQQMATAADLARRCEGVQVIVNHTGMPLERTSEGLDGWRVGMRSLAACENVAVKISGLGMTDPDWSIASIRPFVLEAIEIFGIERCMFASNFPVDGLFSDYDTLYAAYDEITADFSEEERDGMFYRNAERIYRL